MKASSPAIDKYYTSVQKIKDWGGSHKETAIRQAFITLLNHYAEKKDLFLITELSVEGKHGRKVTPDGTLKNALRLDYGYWESKDEEDVIDDEIEKKFKKGYPDRNILFEDSQTAVLIQEGREVLRVAFSDPEKLDQILNLFVNHKHPEARKFEEALKQFKQDIPQILETLRDRIERAAVDPDYVKARDTFLLLCQTDINPDITAADVREMMIQHILTADIFNKIFDEPDFHRQNNIARELEELLNKLFSYSERKNLLGQLEHYYEAINAAAASIKDHHEKQQFLKVLYEHFYKVYNPKAADRLGVVYTPNEIVRFMIKSTNELLHRHFEKTLASRNVEILDPATGTGTFITDLIDHLPKQDLKYKYKNEIHANEVAILPYYVANLNIEFTYKQKMNSYEEFPNLCFVDTLDNTGGLQYGGKQHDMFGMTSENTDRIKRQNSRKISVIIGNPPYNSNQQSENQNNKNREYFQDSKKKTGGVDGRIKDTFIRLSNAQKSKSYDMYMRFYSWAMDRIVDDGIIAYVTNNSFISDHTHDGFRRFIQQEFDYAYIIDLGGNIRKLSGKDGIFLNEAHTIFGQAAAVGIAIMFLVKVKTLNKSSCRINYIHPTDIRATRAEKLEYIRGRSIEEMSFIQITPDKHANWIDQSKNDWDHLVSLYDKHSTNTLFNGAFLGISSNRDEWVYDYNEKSLALKMKYFIDALNSDRKFHYKKGDDSRLNESIKWSRDLKLKFFRKDFNCAYNKKLNVRTTYRPFTKRFLYSDPLLVDILFDKHLSLIRDTAQPANITLLHTGPNSEKPFMVLSSELTADLHFVGSGAGTNCLSQFRYDKDGTRHDNLTDWGLQQFTDHYSDQSITKEAIFHYVYAVLHDPVYREKYALNLKREFPRIPFYTDFWQWSRWGRELMDLHIGYESVEPYPLELISSETKSEAKKKKKTLLDDLAEPEPLYQREYKVKVKLKADKSAGIIELDELTLLKGIPAEAWNYKLGNRSALEWVLDQYKEKKPKDPTIAEKFNTYRFADHKEKVIDLLKRVCTVSVKTMEVVRGMAGAER